MNAALFMAQNLYIKAVCPLALALPAIGGLKSLQAAHIAQLHAGSRSAIAHW